MARIVILLLAAGVLAGCAQMGANGMMYDKYGAGASGAQTGELKVPATGRVG